jgi:hypothetical protein
MEKERIVGGSLPVVGHHFECLTKTMTEGNYLPPLMMNFDETPLLSKTNKRERVLADKQVTYAGVAKDNLIVSCTTAPLIAADGGHGPTAMIFPLGWDLEPLKTQLHTPSDFVFYKTGSGSMTKRTMEDHVHNVILPYFLNRRKEIQEFMTKASSSSSPPSLSNFHCGEYYIDHCECAGCEKVIEASGSFDFHFNFHCSFYRTSLSLWKLHRF